MADLRFCSECESLLDFQNSDSNEVYMICSYCERKTQPAENLNVRIIGRRTGQYLKSAPNMEYDYTLRETNYFTCPNNKCPTNTSGKLPCAGMFNYYNSNRQLALICKYCSYISLLSSNS